MRCALTALLLAFTTVTSLADETGWTRFRGPNGSGVSPDAALPATWSESDYRWQVKLPGVGNSSPVVAGERLFITSGIEDTGNQAVVALQVSDGQVIWKRDFTGATFQKHQFNRYAASTPALDESSVYFLWATPDHFWLVKLDQATGEEKWRRDFGPFASQHGFGSSPMVFEDLVIVANEQDGPSSIIAVDRETGKTRWQTPRRTEKAAFATPCLYQPDGGPVQLILSSWAHGVSALDPRNGKPLWEQAIFKNRVVGSPLVAGGLVIAASGTGGIGRQMYAVRPGNLATGTQAEVAYELKGSLPYVCTPVAKDNLLFSWFDRGVVTCIELSTGKQIWQERIGGEYFGSPVLVGDRLYCISRDGEVVVLAAADQFKLLGRVSLGEPSHATPAVANGTMYLRTMSRLMALGK